MSLEILGFESKHIENILIYTTAIRIIIRMSNKYLKNSGADAIETI